MEGKCAPCDEGAVLMIPPSSCSPRRVQKSCSRSSSGMSTARRKRHDSDSAPGGLSEELSRMTLLLEQFGKQQESQIERLSIKLTSEIREAFANAHTSQNGSFVPLSQYLTKSASDLSEGNKFSSDKQDPFLHKESQDSSVSRKESQDSFASVPSSGKPRKSALKQSNLQTIPSGTSVADSSIPTKQSTTSSKKSVCIGNVSEETYHAQSEDLSNLQGLSNVQGSNNRSVNQKGSDGTQSEQSRATVHYQEAMKDLQEMVETSNSLRRMIVKEQSSIKNRTRFGRFRETLGQDMTGCRSITVSIIGSTKFDTVTASLIMMNAMFIGVQTDWAVRNVGDTQPFVFRLFELFFTAMFTVELVLRIIAQGGYFFSSKNEDKRWNMFDTTVVCAALTEEVIAIAGPTLGLSQVRILRVLRLVRIVRVIRVMQFFRDLRVMVHGIMNSIRALFWCLVLLLMIMFMFAVCFTQVVTDTLETEAEEGNVSAEDRIEKGHHETLLRCLLSLFQAITGGIDWENVADPLMMIHPIMGFLFAAYIAFAVLCVLNVVTGVFVQHADTDSVLEDLSSRRQHIMEMKHLFVSEAGQDKTDTEVWGELDCDRFCEKLRDDRIRHFFKRCGLHIDESNSQSLFEVLDFDGDGTVDAEEFIYGCAQLASSVRSIDIARLRHDVRKMLSAFLSMAKHHERRHQQIKGLVGEIQKEVSKPRSQDSSGNMGQSRCLAEYPMGHMPTGSSSIASDNIDSSDGLTSNTFIQLRSNFDYAKSI